MVAHHDPARCHYCRRRLYRFGTPAARADPDSMATRDHTVPRSAGGVAWVPCCNLCNSIKGDDLYEAFVAFMRFPDAADPRTRRAAYKRFRCEIMRIGVLAFEEEVARMG